MRVFVLGGTGLVGTRLVWRLCERNDTVAVLTRRIDAARSRLPQSCTLIEGDPMQRGSWMAAVRDCDAVVNLVGEPIFGRRWDQSFKTLLRDSRVTSTRRVVEALNEAHDTAHRPRILVNASAIGYYGPHGSETLDETAGPGDDFLAQLTVEWEAAARQAEKIGVRVALLRIGVVLDRAGGALAKMLPFFLFGLGGPIGSGRQWNSWIHHRDVVGLILLALDNDQATGPLNATAPNPCTSKEFARALGRALRRPAFLPVPRFALRLRFGEVADVLTTGQRVLPARALGLGYTFEFPQLDTALAEVLKR